MLQLRSEMDACVGQTVRLVMSLESFVIDFLIICGICTIAIVAMVVAVKFPYSIGSGIGQFNNKELMDKLAEEAKKRR